MSSLLTAERLAHRPWPPPRRPWALHMVWHDLAFLHWRIEPRELRARIPPPLELDLHDGSAWVGVVPFRMSGVRPRGTFDVPGLSAFPELNLRTYVTCEGRPGVWFFTLDVPNPIAVFLARTLFHLPYHRASMSIGAEDGGIAYASTRGRAEERIAFRGHYRPTGPVCRAGSGTLEAWLTERYCLYAADRRGRVFRGEVHHEPWPLQPAEVEVESNSMGRLIGGERLAEPPLAHFARRLEVVAWTLDAVPRLGASSP